MRHLEKSISNVSQQQQQEQKTTTTFKLLDRDARVENITAQIKLLDLGRNSWR